MSNLNFEEALVKLEEVVNKLEKEQLSLDKSLEIFEEGIGLYRLCSKELMEVEKKISIIVEENGEFKKNSFGYNGEEN